MVSKTIVPLVMVSVATVHPELKTGSSYPWIDCSKMRDLCNAYQNTENSHDGDRKATDPKGIRYVCS